MIVHLMRNPSKFLSLILMFISTTILRDSEVKLIPFLKENNDITAAKEEIAQHITFLNLITHFNVVLPIDGSDRHHTDRKNRYQAIGRNFEYYAPSRLNTLPGRFITIQVIRLVCSIPFHLASHSIFASHDVYLLYCSTHWEMITMIVENIQKRVSHRSTIKSIFVLTVGTKQFYHGEEFLRFDLHFVNNVSILINIPYPLWFRVGSGSYHSVIIGESYGADTGRR